MSSLECFSTDTIGSTRLPLFEFTDCFRNIKYNIYRSLCREFSMASYLYKIHIPANRKAMTRLRLSSHKLMIVRGKWLNILPKDRLCTL